MTHFPAEAQPLSDHSKSGSVGSYRHAAEFYDLLYAVEKDYAAEAKLLAALLRDVHPGARSILDVGCGTGSHARSLLDLGFSVDGIDLEPMFVEIARSKCPEGTFIVGDMTRLDLPGRYDVVTCLFSAIGYARTQDTLRATVRCMREHLKPGGVILVDPWFEPGQLSDGWISTLLGKSDRMTVCRMSRTVLQDAISRLEFEYLIGTASGIEHRSEVHELGLFTQEQMEQAFSEAGLIVERRPGALRARGVYIGTLPGA